MGNDPATGKPIIARMGRYGPMVQIGTAEDEEKPKFAKLKPTQSIETISLEEALELFKLGAPLGEYEGLEVSVNIGRYGPYIKFGDQFISVPRGEEPTGVDLKRAIEIIEAKRIEDAPIGFYYEKPITKGKGRFGPFIKWNDMFINVPRAYDFDNLSKQDCDELIQKKIEKEANRFIKQWPEEKISVENARWGPMIKFGKNKYKIGLNKDNAKYSAAELTALELEDVKKIILSQNPRAFDGKAKKAAPKKKAAVAARVAPKKSAEKKKK